MKSKCTLALLSLGKKEKFKGLDYLEKAKGKKMLYLSLEFCEVQPPSIFAMRTNYSDLCFSSMSLDLSIYSNMMQWSFYF